MQVTDKPNIGIGAWFSIYEDLPEQDHFTLVVENDSQDNGRRIVSQQELETTDEQEAKRIAQELTETLGPCDSVIIFNKECLASTGKGSAWVNL